MVKITYDNVTDGGAKNIVEYWVDKHARIRFNFLKNDRDFDNVKVEHIPLWDYIRWEYNNIRKYLKK